MEGSGNSTDINIYFILSVNINNHIVTKLPYFVCILFIYHCSRSEEQGSVNRLLPPRHLTWGHRLCSVQCVKGKVYIVHYHGLAIYTEVTFVSVTLVESVPSGGGPAVV